MFVAIGFMAILYHNPTTLFNLAPIAMTEITDFFTISANIHIQQEKKKKHDKLAASAFCGKRNA